MNRIELHPATYWKWITLKLSAFILYVWDTLKPVMWFISIYLGNICSVWRCFHMRCICVYVTVYLHAVMCVCMTAVNTQLAPPSSIVNCQLLRSLSPSGWDRHAKTWFSPPVCLECFINELNMSAQNPFFPSRTLWDISGKWFMLNSICQTCRLIKWSFALSAHFSVMTFHLNLQLST